MTRLALPRHYAFALLLSALALVTPRRATAQGTSDAVSERAAIVAVAQRLLDAIGSRDTAAARAVLVPGSTLISTREGSTAAPRVQRDTAFLNFIARPSGRMLERMWTPMLQQQGAVATLIAPYDFHIDGRRTHCGTDAFTLLKTTAGWQITNVSYDVRTTGCVDSPLGPPR